MWWWLLLLPCLHSRYVADPDDEILVKNYVKNNANSTFRQPNGSLRFPYLVPSGPYDAMWDWDALFIGVALREEGALPYLAGTMMNFLDHTNVIDGMVKGCLKPDNADGTLYHAKPVVIQGAWLAVKYGGATAAAFLPFKFQMQALLDFWDRPPQMHPLTGLRVWHDQLQSGSDDLVLSQCPSPYSVACWRDSDAFTLASTDLHVFLYREHQAFARFLQAWGDPDLAALYAQRAGEILQIMEQYLWVGNASDGGGMYVGRNVSTNTTITNRVWLGALPLWNQLAPQDHLKSLLNLLTSSDMRSKWGVRSTSSVDPRYSNAKRIVPYSNWRGPVWVNANALLAYGLNSYAGSAPEAGELALSLANDVVTALANDLRNTGTWHECMSSETGEGLAAPDFLSWDTLGGSLLQDLHMGVDPFAI